MRNVRPLNDKRDFQDFLAEEVRKVRGISRPVKAGLLRRILVGSARTRNLHPNPEDEFCDPRIGPNYSIISQYERELATYRHSPSASWGRQMPGIARLQVQRISTGGYQILNGHHRWAAAVRISLPRLRVQVLDITQERDILKMLARSQHDRRATLDLDEVILRPIGDSGFERPLSFFPRRIFKEQIRLGIPSLFQSLAKQGWDVWVYTASYYSTDYLRRLFRLWGCPVAGVITATGRKIQGAEEAKRTLSKMFEEKYRCTVHIDNETVLQTFARSEAFREEPIDTSREPWAPAVLSALRRLPEEE